MKTVTWFNVHGPTLQFIWRKRLSVELFVPAVKALTIVYPKMAHYLVPLHTSSFKVCNKAIKMKRTSRLFVNVANSGIIRLIHATCGLQL
jgi:hypothetical protein